MKIQRLLLLPFFVLLCVGCASTKQLVHFPDQFKDVEDASKGRIYVMRPASFGGGISIDVENDGRIIGTTGPHGFLCWEREPGETVISSQAENTSKLNVNVQAGKVNYVYQSIRMGVFIARNRLVIVSEDEGKKLLRDCNPPKINRIQQ